MRPLFTLDLPLVLASGSPRRQQFLQEWGIPYSVERPHGVEPHPDAGEAPHVYAQRAARAKAQAVRNSVPHAVVLAADTVVAVEQTILGKPRDPADALRMLRMLRGREHEVISAVCLCLPRGMDAAEENFYDSTAVRFFPWEDALLEAYVRTGEPMDKAGAYAIQGQGAFLVHSIRGSWATVVGLPIGQVAQVLCSRGLLHSLPAGA